MRERCVSCHRPEGVAPFSLLSYADVRARAALIADVTARRVMPPWKPRAPHDFLDSRELTEAQIRLIRAWVEGGATEGPPDELPAPPTVTDRWQLGEPDLVVSMPEPFLVRSDGPDVFRTFVIPLAVRDTRFVRGLEFRPGNARVVHHANLGVDRSSVSQRRDEGDPGPGYDGPIAPSADYPQGQMLGWTPGQTPRFVPAGTQWRLEPGNDLVIQLHMQPTGKLEQVQASVALFFTDEPPSRTPIGLRLGSQTIDIPPGDGAHVVTDEYELPVDALLLAIQPHAHNLARRMSASATLPDGARRTLIEIDDWDFRWQEVYRYRDPVRLPQGTRVAMRFEYDNSIGNPRNPSLPPRRVTWGQNTADEMGDLWLQLVTPGRKEHVVLAVDAARKMRAEDIVGYAKLLAGDPADPSKQEALAIQYLHNGQSARAIPHLREALRLRPASAPTHYNLGLALANEKQFADALAHFSQALTLDSTHSDAHYSSAVIHQLAGRQRDAVHHYRRAIGLRPDHVSARRNLAWILATTTDPELHDAHEAILMAERAATLTGREDAAVLDVLAAAYASTGRVDRALAAVEAAAVVAEASGQDELAAEIRRKVEIYRRMDLRR
jgi:Tfp pilus assembly protein PilF